MSGDRVRDEFVDTNILICAFDVTAGEKRRVAVELISRLWLERRGCISLQVLQEFYVAATRKLILEPEQAVLQIGRLGRWRVHRPSVEDVLAAIELHRSHSVSFWDGLILRSAQASQCSILWSEDMSSDQRWGSLEVRNPFQRPDTQQPGS
ncbi:MAG TPA: PIN domain-containing protein [Candidatus Acidoferrales bacterium]|nr:PIN domain-containing protein [Candidatus Acidoferrales bacterium]